MPVSKVPNGADQAWKAGMRLRKVSLFMKLVVVVLTISISGLMGYYAHAGSSPTIPRTGTGGATGPCSWFVSLDGTTPVAEAMVGGLSKNPGDNVVGTAGQDVAAFLQPLFTGSSPLSFCFNAQTFNMASALNAPMDLTIVAYGATFKWTGAAPAANLAMFDNTAAINLKWYGGTVDLNNVGTSTANSVFWGFGSSIGANPSFKLTSAVVRDLNIINCYADCMLMNDISNTNIYISNFHSVKSSTGTIADMNELTGTNVWFQGYLDDNNVAVSAITSASLHNATWWVWVDRTTNGAGTPEVGLQPFTPPTGDTITNVEVWVKGSAVLVNGNLASGALAGQNIRIHGMQGTFIELGTNGGSASGGGEVWKQITVDGEWVLKRNFQMFDYNGLVLQNMYVTSTSALSGVNGIFYLTGTNAADRINDNLVVNNVVFTNVTSGEAGAYFWAQNTGNNKVGNATFIGGSIKGQSNTLASSNYVTAGVGSTALLIQAVSGFNPQPASSISQASPYTNNDGYLEFLTVTTVNGATAMICNGASIGNPVVGTVCSLSPGKSVSWSTANPTFEKQPT